MTPPKKTEPQLDPKQLLETTAAIKSQVGLLEACLQANRLPWAQETLAEIARLANGGAAAPAAKRPWIPPTPEQVQETLLRMIGSRPMVGHDGPLVVCTFNGHLLNVEKAKLMMEPLLHVVRRAHIIMFQESNVDALRLIARAAGYGLNASHRNNREQACGILYHPRVQWLGKAPVYHDYLLDVPFHPEFKNTLRPALQRRVKDVTSNFVFDVIDFHGKSNLGGPDNTRPIRRYSFEQLVAELAKQLEKTPYEPREVKKAVTALQQAVAQEVANRSTPASTDTKGEEPAVNQSAPPVVSAEVEQEASQAAAVRAVDYSGEEAPLGPVLLGGDFNAPLDQPTTTEIEPLIQAGFVLVKTVDGRWTYRYKTEGGQFDGFFARGFKDGQLSTLWVPDYPESKRDQVFYRELSDHLMAFVDISVAAAS